MEHYVDRKVGLCRASDSTVHIVENGSKQTSSLLGFKCGFERDGNSSRFIEWRDIYTFEKWTFPTILQHEKTEQKHGWEVGGWLGAWFESTSSASAGQSKCTPNRIDVLTRQPHLVRRSEESTQNAHVL